MQTSTVYMDAWDCTYVYMYMCSDVCMHTHSRNEEDSPSVQMNQKPTCGLERARSF